MENKKIIIIVQARYGSTRFPGKIFQNIDKKKRIIDLILEKIDNSLELKTVYYNLIILEGPEHYIKNYVDSDNSDDDNDNSGENYSGYSIGFAKIIKSYNENAF